MHINHVSVLSYFNIINLISSFSLTATITLTSADMWYKKLRETIDKQQQQSIWVSESKVRILSFIFSVFCFLY